MTLTTEQLALRREGITSTDIAAICGLSPKSALAVYWDKVGEAPPIPQTEPMWWGSQVEPLVAARYELAARYSVARPSGPFQHPNESWMLATPDGFVLVDGLAHAIARPGQNAFPLPNDGWGVELKTAIAFKQVKRWGGVRVDLPPPNAAPDYYEAVQRIAEANGANIPEEYLVQDVWGMEVCQLDRWDTAVLLAGYHGFEYRQYCIRRTKKVQCFIDVLVERGRRFHEDHVLARVPPEPDGSGSAAAVLKAMYAQESADIRLADSEQEELLAEYAGANEDWQEADLTRETLRQRIVQTIGAAEGIETKDRKMRATWKANVKGHRRFNFEGG